MSEALPALCLIAMPGRRRRTIELCREAERRGFDGIYVPSPMGNMSICEALAWQTEKIRFATSIVPIYQRTMVDFTQSAAMMHEVSGGRFSLGIGKWVDVGGTDFRTVKKVERTNVEGALQRSYLGTRGYKGRWIGETYDWSVDLRADMKDYAKPVRVSRSCDHSMRSSSGSNDQAPMPAASLSRRRVLRTSTSSSTRARSSALSRWARAAASCAKSFTALKLSALPLVAAGRGARARPVPWCGVARVVTEATSAKVCGSSLNSETPPSFLWSLVRRARRAASRPPVLCPTRCHLKGPPWKTLSA